MPPRKTSRKPQHIAKQLAIDTEIKERQQAVFRYWRDNPLVGYRAIGKKFRISHEQARKDLKAVLLANVAEFRSEVEEWKEKQIERLEFLLETFEKQAKGRGSQRIEAGRLLLATIKEINEITGVRAAQKVEHSGTIGFSWPEITASAKSGENLTDE